VVSSSVRAREGAVPSAQQNRKEFFTPVRRPSRIGGTLIQEARRRDLPALVALDQVCFGALAWPPHGWWQVIQQPGWRARLVREGMVVVAASVLLSGLPVMVVASVGVHPDCRRRGLGRALLEDALSQASQAGASWLSLEVDRDNRVAQRLYRGVGFCAARRFVEDGRERLEMVRRMGRSRGPTSPTDERLKRNQARIGRP
jgi:[ribosomal protein S18]-alanine N-acetyltransferase